MFETTEKRINKQYGTITYWENGVMIGRKCSKCGEDKVIDEFGFEGKGRHRAWCKECEIKRVKEYRKNNMEKCRVTRKRYVQKNAEKMKEYWKQYRQEHLEHKKEIDRIYHTKTKENNLQHISNMIGQINSTSKNLPVYGYIYKFENIKTRRVYIGQTTKPLKYRYNNDIVKGWIKERLEKVNQKFINELIEKDIEVTEVFDVAFCQYHLNIIEAYWIKHYDSYNNGYNNNAGHYKDDTGKEEFEQILKENGLEFIDGKLVKIA